MRTFHANGYETCVHSRERKNAPWKVWDSCSSRDRLPSGNGYQLPYKNACLRCPFYCLDGTMKKKGEQYAK